MTVSYALALSSVGTCTFLKLLKKWKGSVLKIVWKELLIWLIAYTIISLLLNNCFSLDDLSIIHYEIKKLDDFLHYFDLKFLLGFFVNIVVDRWKQILQNISFIETVALSTSTIIRGRDDNSRLARRSIIRYLVLSQILVLRDISMRVRRRFPNMKSLIESGFLFENELRELNQINTAYNIYWAPINWANSIVWRMQQQKYIEAPVSTNNLLNNIRDFRITLENLCKFDWVPIPIAYPQVVFLAVRVYFVVCLFSRQYISQGRESTIFRYLPIMTSLQFIFYVGWMKTGMQIVDGSHNECPVLNIDRFADPKFGPMYPAGSSSNGQIGCLQGSVADVIIPQSESNSKMIHVDEASTASQDKTSNRRSSIRQRFNRISSKLSVKRTISNPKSPTSPTAESINSFKNLGDVTEENESINDKDVEIGKHN